MTMGKKLIDNLSKFAAFSRQGEKTLIDAELDSKWAELTASEPKKLFNEDATLIVENLKRFRRLNVFVSDMYPCTDYANWNPRHWWRKGLHEPGRALYLFLKERLSGSSRGNQILMRDIFDILQRDDAIDLLRKYPAEVTPGSPFTYNFKGYNYNLRWVRHIYFNNLLNRFIGDKILDCQRFINLDIGSGYGTFSYIFKMEHENTTQILLDFPEQLILAYYFLGTLFPNAKFCTLMDISEEGMIDRSMLEQYDFVLLPVEAFKRIAPGSVDMVSNFFSFGEMPREWFNAYVQSDLFRSVEFFFTCNRFESAPRMEPTYDTDLTVLDYPLSEFETVFFGVNPIYPYYLKPFRIFSYRRCFISSQYFDYIGRRRNKK